MFETPIFEGSVEEFVERKEEFAGRRVSVFDTLDTNEIDIPTPRTTVRSKEHLFELLDEGLASPMEPLSENEFEMIKQEVAKRLAERKTTE